MEKIYKILVIDDDAEAIFVINQILLKSTNKYEILNAFNAESALKIIKNEIPDLIISDWDMPNISGIELIKKLKNNSETACIPVIICTGMMKSSEDLLLAYESGAIDYIRKPVVEFELIGRINAMLRFTESYKHFITKKESFFENEKKFHEEKIELINTELNNRILLMNKYNELLKNIYDTLTKIPHCTNNHLCKPFIDEVFKNIECLNLNEKWEELFISFEKVNPNFFTKMLHKYPDLTKSELKMAAMLKLKHTTKEISAITGQTVRAVEMTRFRLRTKMGLKTDENIENYL